MKYMRALLFSVVIFSLCSDVNAQDPKVIDLDQYRAVQDLTPLTGTYFHKDAQGNQELVSFSIESGTEIVRHASEGGPNYYYESIPLKGSQRRTHLSESGMLSGHVVISHRVHFRNGEVRSEETILGRWGLSVRTETYKLEGSVLTRTIVRNLFRRKFLVAGPWVLDNNSTFAKNNSISSDKTIYHRVSSKAYAGRDLSALATRMNLNKDRPDTHSYQTSQVIGFSELQERRRLKHLMSCVNLF